MTKKVFFLGAGFSKAIDNNYPLMPELTDNIEQKIAKSSVAEHYGEISPLIKKDIEALLTYLSTDFPWKNDTRKHANKALYFSILDIISEQFKELAKDGEKVQVFEPIWKDFSEFVRSNAVDCSFITLNYDILLEDIISHAYPHISFRSEIFGNLYQYPMENICSRNGHVFVDGSFDEPLPALLKLHGSANWFWAGITPSDAIYYRLWDDYEENNIDMGLKPYIIPPVMDKNAFYNHIAIHALWQQAEKLLKEADEVYIIGFSFPQTDLSVKYLFQSALRKSNAKIYVVNPEKEETLRVNYNKVFGDDNKNVCYDYSGRSERDYTVTERFISEKCKI